MLKNPSSKKTIDLNWISPWRVTVLPKNVHELITRGSSLLTTLFRNPLNVFNSETVVEQLVAKSKKLGFGKQKLLCFLIKFYWMILTTFQNETLASKIIFIVTIVVCKTLMHFLSSILRLLYKLITTPRILDTTIHRVRSNKYYEGRQHFSIYENYYLPSFQSYKTYSTLLWWLKFLQTNGKALLSAY